MKFRKLLAGAAVAALTAGTASALDLTLTGVGVAAAPAAPGVPVSTVPVGLALEGNNISTGTSDTAEILLQVNTDANIAAANNYLITVNITGGTFGRNVVGTDLINGPGSVTFSGTNVQFDGSNRTGEEGDTSVRFLATNNAVGDDFQIRIPVKTDCTTPVTFSMSLSTEAGTPIEEGSAVLRTGTTATAVPLNAIVCVDAYSATIARDDVAVANDSVVTLASGFKAFDISKTSPASTGAVADTATVATLGTITYTFDPTNARSAAGALSPTSNIYANLGDITGGAGALPILPVADAEFTLTTSSRAAVAALDTFTFPATSTATSAAIDNTAAGTTTGNNTVANITATLVAAGATTPAVTQPTTVTASAGTLNYTLAAQGLTDEAIVMTGGGVLDLINYEAGICGTFDWVGDSTTSRRNVWRVTGATRAVANGVFASMTNSSAGLASSTLQITPAVNTAQEIIITDAELTAAFGNFGRADFSFSFAGDVPVAPATAAVMDCDRLQSSPAASIVTPFGNSTGLTPGVNDGDD